MDTYFAMEATIEFPMKKEIIYCIDGGNNWSIVGRVKTKFCGDQLQPINIRIQGLPLIHGKLQVPQIILYPANKNEEITYELICDAQSVTVISKKMIEGLN